MPDVQPAARLGQHNRYILNELLGISNEDIINLEKEGIIGTVPLSASQPGVHQSPPIPEMLEQGIIRGYDPGYLDILGIKPDKPEVI